MIIHDSGETPEVKPRTKLENPSNKRSPSSSRSVTPTLIAAAMILGSTGSLNYCEGCDTTLFLQNNGKVCNDNECTTLNMYNFPISTGGVVCFKDFNDNKLTVKIQNTRYRSRYQSLYHTSDVNITHHSISECKASTTYCWNGGCHVNDKHPSFTNINDKMELIVLGHSCDTEMKRIAFISVMSLIVAFYGSAIR